MSKDLELIGHPDTIELQHDRGIEGGDVAMPDVASNPGEIDGGEATFESARQRHLRDAMALAQIFSQKERVDTGGIATHDHVLVVVRKNLRLDKVAWAQKLGQRTRFPHRAQGTLTEPFVVVEVGAL